MAIPKMSGDSSEERARRAGGGQLLQQKATGALVEPVVGENLPRFRSDSRGTGRDTDGSDRPALLAFQPSVYSSASHEPNTEVHTFSETSSVYALGAQPSMYSSGN